MQNAKFQNNTEKNYKSEMLNVNCKMQNMKFVIELQNTSVRFEIIDVKCKIPNVECRM